MEKKLLLDLYFSEELSQENKEKFLLAVEHDEVLKRKFIELQQAKALSELSPCPGDEEMAHVKLLELDARVRNLYFRKKMFVFSRYAAIFVILLGTAFFLRNSFSPNEKYIELQVPIGQRQLVELSDGSVMWINSGSKVRYSNQFGIKNRNIELDGEAYFEVKKDPVLPFVVKTSKYQAEVLGTKFNVVDYERNPLYETTLQEGRVKIYKEKEQKNSIVLSPNEQAFLKDDKLVVRNVDASQFLRWMEGLIVFHDETLGAILEKVNLYYDVLFVCKNKDSLKNTYTGKFILSATVDEFLQALQRTNQFNYYYGNDKKTIYIE